VVGRPDDGSEGSGLEKSSAGSLGAQNWGKEERGRSSERGDAEVPIYRVGGGVGQLGDGGERAAAVVRYNGGGGSRFGRGSTGVVGSNEGGGVLRPFWEQKGGVGRWRARTHVRRQWQR
jgi:hypothetical protein